MDETIEILGIRIRKSPASSVCKPSCAYLEAGFCKTCTCGRCESGFLMEEWRQDIRNGGTMCGPRECDCVERARNRKRLRDSGLEKLADRCSFDSYTVQEPWQEIVKNTARDYLSEVKRMSFFISGQSGCGKTHICTAICNEIIKAGGRLRYFQWVRDGTRLKQIVNERGQYEKEIDDLIEMPYLYMDDLFKQEITAADIRLVYEIVNGRYIAERPTILSSERNLAYIRSVRDGDGEAIAGRIFETCGYGRFCIQLSGADKNQRFSVR